MKIPFVPFGAVSLDGSLQHEDLGTSLRRRSSMPGPEAHDALFSERRLRHIREGAPHEPHVECARLFSYRALQRKPAVPIVNPWVRSTDRGVIASGSNQADHRL